MRNYRSPFLLLLIFCLVLQLPSAYCAPPSEGILILAYHDIVDAPALSVSDNRKLNTRYAVSTQTFISHLEYLRQNNYTLLSLQDYMDICSQRRPCPPKAVLLTFDDGYISFYEKVYPLLQKYNYPCLLAVVNSWLDDGAPADVGPVVTWAQLREMEANGLVAIASHSAASHRYIPMTPQDDRWPALASFYYRNNAYESFDEHIARIRADLDASQASFVRELGHKSPALVWPYGAYSLFGAEQAQAAGFSAQFGLFGGSNPPHPTSLQSARRGQILDNPTQPAFARFLAAGTADTKPLRIAQLDLDAIFVPGNPVRTDANLLQTIRYFQATGINTVFLQSFADLAGDGNMESVYFHTSRAPVSADLFGHVVVQLKNNGFDVYAWAPTLASQWIIHEFPVDRIVASPRSEVGWYRRASPFSTQVWNRLEGLYSDLAAYAPIDGVLFQDDLYLNDFEDFSPAARAAYRKHFGRDLSPEELRSPVWRNRWTQLKTETLIDLTQSLRREVRLYRPEALMARNIYAEPILQPESEEWYAQNYTLFLSSYDWTVVMAYPYMEKASDPTAWLQRLARTALKNPSHTDKVVFKLQAIDWRTDRWLAPAELRHWESVLLQAGATHLGYYPQKIPPAAK